MYALKLGIGENTRVAGAFEAGLKIFEIMLSLTYTDRYEMAS